MKWYAMIVVAIAVMADQAKAFVGPDCALCKDPEWEIKKKNMR